ncbi:amidase [Corynebacterium felinum]|uniref:amidase n=1 Tax=Corynebacterium felinum TaxID=131318 RepID=A0ABU2B632_9CORY|nr:amidase [Corynebacterium felinum]MDF5820808.1 amidase [Corynebacterium felinum]MDR7354076.1 amidase [Corynebacterium felinum]WJY96248.1 Enantioselective amidase [Corynebacterium felinum]
MADSLEALVQKVQSLRPEEHGFAYFDPDILTSCLSGAHTQPTQRRPQEKNLRLSGWIIPAKDLSDVAGMPTTMGNASRRYIAADTDAFVARYQRQGALVPGKSLSPEMGLSAYTEPVGLPHPDNPTQPGHTPGGSSGGAAVMVARGLVRAAHATDGGGSIRVPAACTGLVGFKPAHDTTNANPVAQGFLTSTLADSAYVHGITPQRQLRRLRVGVLTTPVHADVEVADHMGAAVEKAAGFLSAVGHEVVEVARPYGDGPFLAFQHVLCARARRIPGPASPLVEWLRAQGEALSDRAHQQAVETFMSVRSLVLAAWDCDVLLSPMLAFDPPKIGHFSSMSPDEDFYAQTQWTPWATMFNMSGLAALCFPYASVRTPIHLGALRVSAAELFALAAQLDEGVKGGRLCSR